MDAVKITAEMVQTLLPPRSEQEWKEVREQFLSRGYVEGRPSGVSVGTSNARLRAP